MEFKRKKMLKKDAKKKKRQTYDKWVLYLQKSSSFLMPWAPLTRAGFTDVPDMKWFITHVELPYLST